VSPVSWPDFAPQDQASLVRVIERKVKMVEYGPT
jgi:hypothetical protein